MAALHPPRESERREATVVFADISGFTALSEKLDPEAITDVMNRCFAILEGIVLAHGGWVDKYLGDCVVAAFGLRDDGTAEGATRAVRAAMEIRSAIQGLNREVSLPATLDVHVGIATGPVLVGEIGGAVMRSLTVTGEAVDLAVRLEDESDKGEIFVSARTAEDTGEEFEYEPLAAIGVADDQEPVPIFSLAGVRRGRRRVKRPSERRQATVLFAEITGFKALAQTRSPEALTALLNRCFAALETAVVNYGGVIDKYIGEGVMALFGVPNAIEHAPRQAVNAAIEMRKRLTQLGADEGLAAALGMHVGINTGLVIAGELGGRAKRDFTVMGDTVNLASRLKGAARDGSIYVGPETHRATQAEFEYRSLPPLSLKGKAQPVPTFELVSVTEQVEHTRSAEVAPGRTIGSAMVGREAEFGRLAQAVREVREGHGGIVSVVGEAGIGKSRLLRELRALETLRDTTVLEGRSLSIGQGLSFHPFVDLVRRWAGITDQDGESESATKLAGALGVLMPDELDDVFPFIATLTGLRVSGAHADRIAGVEGEAMEELIFRSMQQFLRRLAGVRPVVLVFEDLHWADQSSVKLLESLLRLVSRHPILFVAVGRPDFPDTFDRILACARERHAEASVEIALTQLTDQQCDALIQNLLQVDDLPYATRALIIRKAEGNPFYIEEVVRSLIDQGAVVHQDGRYRLTEKIDSVIIPGTIQEVIMTRVDRLDEPSRYVLQVAAVIGRFFPYAILSVIVGDEEDLDARLADLRERQLVFPRQAARTVTPVGEERQYVFKHALVQDTVYDAILQKTRKEMHLRVAQSIESTYAERLTDYFGMLAYHYSRAEDPGKAEEYLFKAGEEAARAAASIEALNFFREASRLYMTMYGAGGDPRKKALLEKNIALALLNTGALTESIDHFDAALAHLGERVPKSALGAQVAFGGNLVGMLGHLYLGLGRRRQVEDWDREREVCHILFNRGRAEITSDPTRLFFDAVSGVVRLSRIDAAQIDQASSMYASCAGVFCYSGISFAVSKRVLGIARQFMREGNVRDLFTCASMEFIHNYLAGDWSDAHVIDEALVDEALRHGQLWDVNTYIGLYCDRRLRQGDFAGARKLLARLADMNDAYGYGFAGANHDGMTAILLAEERRLPEALRAVDVYHTARHEDALKVLGLGTRAKIQAFLGDGEGARATLEAAAKIASRSREVPPWHLSGYAVGRLRTDLLALERRPADGETRLRVKRSVRYALGIAAKVAVQRVEIHQLVGRVTWLLGQRDKAIAQWRRAVEIGTTLGARPELARTYAEAGRCLEEAGGQRHALDGLDGPACLARAHAMFAELGLAWDLERAQALGRAA